MLAASLLDHGFQLCSGQAKDYKIGICCFSAKHVVLSSKISLVGPENKDKMSEWGNMSTYMTNTKHDHKLSAYIKQQTTSNCLNIKSQIQYLYVWVAL